MNAVFTDKEPVKAAKITPTGPSLVEQMKGQLNAEAAVINDFVSFFSVPLGLGGKDLFEVVIKPLSGDFNRIRANGVAWEDTGKMLSTVMRNFRHNTGILVTTDVWSGDAASAFLNTVDVGWWVGMGAAADCCKWMKKGFDKVAEFAEWIAKKCAKIFGDILHRLTSLAKKSVPFFGQIWEVIEWIASGFDWNEFPYISEVTAIARLIEEIQLVHRSLTDAVAKIEGYFKAFNQAVDVVKAIPDTIDKTLGDVQALGQEFDRVMGQQQGTLDSIDQLRE